MIGKLKVVTDSYSALGDLLSKARVHLSNELSVMVKSVRLAKADGLLMPSVPVIVNTALPPVSMTS